MNRIKARAIFALISIAASAPLSLITTYLYGEFHQHDRYWEGTIVRTNERYAKVMDAIFTQIQFRELALVDPEFLQELFEPLNGIWSITLTHEGNVIFDNRYPDRAIKDPLVKGQWDDLAITVAPYQPPVWSEQIIEWVFSPTSWFSYRWDFITYPFLSFLCIYLLMSFAFGWRVRVGHLEHEVLDKMRGN